MIIRCLGASRLVVTCVVLAQSLFLSLAGLLGAFLAYWGIGFTAARLIREKTGVVIRILCPWSRFPQENERQSFWDLVEEEGYEALWPGVEPFFPLFGFSAWNFSHRICKRLDSSSSGIPYQPFRQPESEVLNSAGK